MTGQMESPRFPNVICTPGRHLLSSTNHLSVCCTALGHKDHEGGDELQR